jgi:hypothetical protein
MRQANKQLSRSFLTRHGEQRKRTLNDIDQQSSLDRDNEELRLLRLDTST